jgi:hypothetical protein
MEPPHCLGEGLPLVWRGDGYRVFLPLGRRQLQKKGNTNLVNSIIFLVSGGPENSENNSETNF